jgi:1,6-anhydro-N-acetylmuramate kinase
VQLGLNCGTSVDAVDVAYCEIAPSSDTGTDTLLLSLLGYSEVAVSPALKARVLRACRSNLVTMDEICDLNFALGEEFAHAVTTFMRERGLVAGVDVDMVASHGQTLWHIPLPEDGDRKSTLQMAVSQPPGIHSAKDVSSDAACISRQESAVIAHRTGLTTTSDFRVGDVAAGRQGAPLVAFLDAAVLVHPTRLVASQNLGGIGNVCNLFFCAEYLAFVFSFDVG